MNEYRISCFDCEDECIVSTGSDIPSFCPLCGSEDTEVVAREEMLLDSEDIDFEE